MSEEEKKAIVELNHYINITAYWKQEEYTNSEIDNYIKTILNLIENQQQELQLKDKVIDVLTEKLEEKSRWMTKLKWKEFAYNEIKLKENKEWKK